MVLAYQENEPEASLPEQRKKSPRKTTLRSWISGLPSAGEELASLADTRVDGNVSRAQRTGFDLRGSP